MRRSARLTARRPFQQLREWIDFWEDRARLTPCCLWADEAAIAEDPDLYDCETCVVAEWLGRLDPANARAWSLFRQLVTRLAVDLQCGSEVLRRLTADVSDEEWPDLWARLVLIDEALRPVKDASHGA